MSEAKRERGRKVYNPASNNLIDLLITKMGLTSDADLARKLQASGPAISKIRHGNVTLGADFLIKVHEASGMTISEVREMVRSSDQKDRLYQVKAYLPKEKVENESNDGIAS